MHDEAWNFVAKVRPLVTSGKRIVEFGGRNVNGNVGTMFDDCLYYHAIDIRPGDGVDIVADAATWDPGPLVQYDVVICTEVLEHAPDAEGVVANAYRVLSPGGVFIMTCATDPRLTHSGVDGHLGLYPGEHYRNVPPDEMAVWLRPFKASRGEVLIGSDPDHGDLYVFARKGGGV